jgi:lipopolysaccharide/colanic/teichoic acid biosynthesis glycosyltransferase
VFLLSKYILKMAIAFVCTSAQCFFFPKIQTIAIALVCNSASSVFFFQQEIFHDFVADVR